MYVLDSAIISYTYRKSAYNLGPDCKGMIREFYMRRVCFQGVMRQDISI